MSKRLSIVKSCLIGAVPVVVLLAAAPVRPALAQFGDIFGAITGTENSIGTLLSGVGQCVNEMNTLRQTTLAPVAELVRIQNGILGTVNAYRGWMSSVFGTSIASGQTAGVLNLESNLLQGSSIGGGVAGGTFAVNVSSPFATVYGAIPNAWQANSARAQQVDLTDALAKDAMTQGAYADASANSAITLAHTF